MQKLIDYTRKLRNFQPAEYIDKKIAAINKFFREENLDAAVLGLSGGIDSMVVLRLLLKAKEQPNSPIKKVAGMSIPIEGIGAVNQFGNKCSVEREMDKKDLNGKFDYHVVYAESAIEGITKYFPVENENAWAQGQLFSLIRTPIFYYQAALLQGQGLKSIVVGTTNRDEGSYIGFFGKYSDMAVDLQPIADLHKSEVRAVAKLLDISDEFINKPATGDVWDGKNTEEMMGFDYEFLECYLLWKEFDMFPADFDSICGLTNEDLNTIDRLGVKVETWHKKNSHKYRSGFMCKFIDVINRKIPGGWQ